MVKKESGAPGSLAARRPRLLPKAVRDAVAAGLCVLPVRPKSKVPALRTWTPYIRRLPTELELRRWFMEDRGLFVVTGKISRVVVLDIDSPGGEVYWHNIIGDAMDATAMSTTGKGKHFWFRIEDERIQGWGQHEGDVSFDLRAEGQGVVAPPSLHENGQHYTWIRDLSHLVALPNELRKGGDTSDTKGGKKGSGKRSMLSELLMAPSETGGRNDWLAKVAGHYAKTFATKEDAYRLHVAMANRLLSEPLPDSEVKKTADSLWGKQDQRTADKDEMETVGWLEGDGTALWGKTAEGNLLPVADFDIVVRGWAEGEGWMVDLTTADRVFPALITPATLADRRKLRTLLAGFGLSFGSGANRPGLGEISDRLIRYMKAQDAPQIRVLPRYDYDPLSEGFVTDDGIIRAGATALVAAPVAVRARDHAWVYGFKGGPSEAKRVLKEVLRWHDETLVAVFGSWWAACMVKFWVDEVSSQFPVMALQAPSESGKSTGFFPSMLALNGNRIGPHDSTRAALRDSLASNRTGIVWVDDTSHADSFMDLVRQVTVGGSMRKKSPEFEQESAKLVGPLLISGESVGIHGEKALLDRTVFVEVPTPKDRVDSKTGQLQWNQIVNYRRTHPDLTEYAGSLMAEAMKHRDIVNTLPELRVGAGRESDKWAVLRVGALILEKMTRLTIVPVVDEWISTRTGPLENENKLTLEHLPRALVYSGMLNRPRTSMGSDPPTPVFVDENSVIWFNPMYLTEWLVRTSRKTADDRVDSVESIRQQAQSLGIHGRATRKNFRLMGSARGMAQYYRIDGALAEEILERAHGVRTAPSHDDLGGSLTRTRVRSGVSRGSQGSHTVPIARPPVRGHAGPDVRV